MCRHHRYIFEEKEKRDPGQKVKRKRVVARLQELGPRFALKLLSMQKGTWDSRHGEYEWIHKVCSLPLASQFPRNCPTPQPQPFVPIPNSNTPTLPLPLPTPSPRLICTLIYNLCVPILSELILNPGPATGDFAE